MCETKNWRVDSVCSSKIRKERCTDCCLSDHKISENAFVALSISRPFLFSRFFSFEYRKRRKAVTLENGTGKALSKSVIITVITIIPYIYNSSIKIIYIYTSIYPSSMNN